MSNSKMIGIGTMSIAVGLFPTPDDVTIISPLVQIIGGGALVLVGLFSKEKWLNN